MAKSFDYLEYYHVFNRTVAVTPGTEPDLGLAVDLTGAPSANAKGVVVNSREGYITLCMLGQVGVKVADSATIAVGDPLTTNTFGEVLVATTGTDILGLALQEVTAASNDYINVFVNPQPVV